MYILNVLATCITHLKPIILNILKLLVILIIFSLLNIANQRKIWKYIHITHIIEFQHNSLQIAQLKAGINYKDY